MKFFVVFALVIVAALAAPVTDESKTTVIKNESDVRPDGYNFAYETSDGVSRSETAEVKNAGTDNEAISIRGTITWTALDGLIYTLNYLADENGFQPEGKHLPVV